MATRPLTIDEYKNIMNLLENGFIYIQDNNEKKFRPNHQVALALRLEANLGLRISDVLRLQVKSFRGNKLEIIEKKTNKLQYRDIDPNITNMIKDYAIEKGLKNEDYIITISEKAIQKQLRIVCAYLQLDNISTHSFRKMYATNQYELNNNNIELIKELLNHTSIATTQRYIKVSQQAVNRASANYFIG